MDLFNTLANAINPHAAILAAKRAELATIEGKINTLNRVTYGTDEVSKHFYLGRVGGSGRNVHRLNKKRERDLEKTIENAKKIRSLNAEKKSIEAEIKALENGTWRPEAEIKAEAKEKREKTRNALAEKEKQERKAMSPEQRLFIGDYPGGTVYADRAVIKNGDYKRIAFVSKKGQISWDAKRIQPELKALIEQHIEKESQVNR